jgi:tryptophan-rich sensory protein
LTLAASVAAQGLGTWFTSRSVTTWYPTLVKPTWTPPAWVFAPVWTALYLLMAVAAWLVWRERARSAIGGALSSTACS